MGSNNWGTITWEFFHTLAEKIKEEDFENNKSIFINIIIETCNHLPCPDCSQHAANTLKKCYFNNIKTKKHFIEFLRQFHNIVNIKIGKKELSRLELVNKYKDRNISSVLINLINTYKSIKTSDHLMSYNLQRNIFLNKLLKDLNNKKHLLIN